MKTRIKADMMAAWKAKETKKKDFLKFIIGEIERKEDAQTKLNDSEIEDLLRGIIKNLNRVSTMESLSEAAMASVYLPSQMDEGDIRETAVILITNGGYSGMKDMGKVMGDFNANFKGQADRKILSGIVKQLLN